MKPTDKWIEGLRWIAAREPVGWVNEDGPTSIMRGRLERRGLIERCIEPGRVGVPKFRLTAAGRALLKFPRREVYRS